jgi:hypothetical protein
MRGDQPYLNPVGINIPEFKKLWTTDKTTEKIQYAKELAYVFHMCDYESPYFDMINKQEEVAKAFIGKDKYSAPQRVVDCIDLYERMQYGAEKRALDSAINLCDSITELVSQSESDSKQMKSLMMKIDISIREAEDVFEEMSITKEKMLIRKQAIDLAAASTSLVTKMEQTIDSLLKLRIKVIQSLMDDSNNNKKISHFLINDLLDE